MIRTYNITVYFDGYTRVYHNVSIPAIKSFLKHHRDNPDFYGYASDCDLIMR